MNILQSDFMLPLETKNTLDINPKHSCFNDKSYEIDLQNLNGLRKFAFELKNNDIDSLIDCYWNSTNLKHGICYKYATVLCSLILKMNPKQDIYVVICHDSQNFYSSIHASVVFRLDGEWVEIDLTKDEADTIVNHLPLDKMAHRVISIFNNKISYINVVSN